MYQPLVGTALTLALNWSLMDPAGIIGAHLGKRAHLWSRRAAVAVVDGGRVRAVGRERTRLTLMVAWLIAGSHEVSSVPVGACASCTAAPPGGVAVGVVLLPGNEQADTSTAMSARKTAERPFVVSRLPPNKLVCEA